MGRAPTIVAPFAEAMGKGEPRALAVPGAVVPHKEDAVRPCSMVASIFPAFGPGRVGGAPP